MALKTASKPKVLFASILTVVFLHNPQFLTIPKPSNPSQKQTPRGQSTLHLLSLQKIVRMTEHIHRFFSSSVFFFSCWRGSGVLKRGGFAPEDPSSCLRVPQVPCGRHPTSRLPRRPPPPPHLPFGLLFTPFFGPSDLRTFGLLDFFLIGIFLIPFLVHCSGWEG